MFLIPARSSDEELLSIARGWIDVLARQEYETIFDTIGYARRFDVPGPEAIRKAIERYRCEEFFPGEKRFVVTDWRTAHGGNPQPNCQIVRYAPQPQPPCIRCAIGMDLSLNGRWSDLEIDFVVWELEKNEKDWMFVLEDISCTRQLQEEFERRESSGN